MAKKNWRPFEEAREYVREQGLRNTEEWREWCKSSNKPPDIPAAPNYLYKGEWISWGDFLGTGNRSKKDAWRPFKEAREYARSLGFGSQTDWREWKKLGQRPPDIPSNPYQVYKEWIGWGDFLGTGNVGQWEWRSFEEAREYARGLGLRSFKEWREWKKTGRMPADIPSNPQTVYKEAWLGWGDFLGTGNRYKGAWRPFEEAREYARSLGLGRQTEWKKLGQRPLDIPANPQTVYKEAWLGWGDFLGTGNVGRQVEEWRSFEEAREYARGLGFRRQEEWAVWTRTGQKPIDIPAKPENVYKEWRGTADWLGYTPQTWSRIALVTFLGDLRPHLPYLAERELYAILQQGGAMPTLLRKFGKGSPLKVLKDLKDNNGRGIVDAVRETDDDDPEIFASDDLFEETAEADTEVSKDVTDALDAPVEAAEESEAVASEAGMPSLVSSEGLRAVDDLTHLPGGIDNEVAEYLVANRVAALWDAWINGEDVFGALAGEGGHYFNLIRERFSSECAEVENLEVPSGWSFHINGSGILPPNAMQMRTAWAVLTKRRVGNWSGAGAGKTNSAILTSRVVEASNTLILAANATIEGWAKAIKIAFPDSVIHTKPEPLVSGRFNYTILNYEKFQQANRGTLARQLRDLGYDFVVLDEVQMAKQRDANKSYRRETLEALVQELAEVNPELRVLGMSATPVINNLYEGRKLLEIVLRRSFCDLDHRPTVSNALAVHRALMVYGFRYKPQYEIEFGEPEVVETVCNDLIDDLQAASGVLRVEQTLLQAKLEAILPYMRRGTLIYTHYVDGMVHPTRQFLESMGFRVGVYTGKEKTGLDDFKAERVDVLIGSQPVSTGVDGLQSVCDRIVVLSPPWTGAEYEQLLGRVRRQGSAFEKVEVIWPQVVLDHHGDRWSWDARRQQVIEYKRTLSDCAVDGNIPDALSISPTALLRKSREALEEWIARIEEKGLSDYERAKLEVPLPPELREKARVRHGDFTRINNLWSTSNSQTVHERLKTDSSEWYLYHTYYRKAREGWPEVPAELIATHLRARPDLKVGDFGCGECLLRDALPDHEVISLDHVAIDDSATSCDIAHTPLDDESLGAAVFSLSLMGKNWSDYLQEAHRTLQPFGLLFIVEPVKRWGEGKLEQAVDEHGFTRMFSYQREDFRYIGAIKAE